MDPGGWQMRTMAQKRAEVALEEVIKIKSDKGKFETFAKGAPSMILQNGFGQSLAFWLAKGTDKHIELFNMVKNWLSLKRGDINNAFTTQTDRRKFIEELAGMEQSQYLSAQSETLAFLEWVKRFASAGL
jgi:CRISPR-associated protein Cmr5